MRYFTHAYSGSRQERGKSSGKLYWFSFGVVTPVSIEEDAEWFLHHGTPENGVYPFRETDLNGNPVGTFPPINADRRQASIDIRNFPTDEAVPDAAEWRLTTEVFGDPVLYFHHIRKRLR